MQLKRILCPIDFSSTGDLAFQFASTLASKERAKLFIVYVEDSPTPHGSGLYGSLPTPISTDCDRLWDLKPDGHVKYEHCLLLGDPVKEICRFIEEKSIDLVVIGSHGRRGISRLVMGSVAEGVVRNASVPVLTVKTPRPVESEEEPIERKNAS